MEKLAVLLLFPWRGCVFFLWLHLLLFSSLVHNTFTIEYLGEILHLSCLWFVVIPKSVGRCLLSFWEDSHSLSLEKLIFLVLSALSGTPPVKWMLDFLLCFPLWETLHHYARMHHIHGRRIWQISVFSYWSTSATPILLVSEAMSLSDIGNNKAPNTFMKLGHGDLFFQEHRVKDVENFPSHNGKCLRLHCTVPQRHIHILSDRGTACSLINMYCDMQGLRWEVILPGSTASFSILIVLIPRAR